LGWVGLVMSFPSYLSIFLIFFNDKIYYIYKGIKSQGLHQKEKIKTPKKPPKKNHQHPQIAETPNSSSSKNQHR